LLAGKSVDGWTKWFLITAVATTLTGFFFPFHGITPAIKLGIISSGVLVVTIYARYAKHLAGAWRWIYVVGAVLTLYFNVFVGIVQSFEKIPALNALAPTQTEPLFTFTPARCSRAFRPPYHSRGHPVPAGTGSHNLIQPKEPHS